MGGVVQLQPSSRLPGRHSKAHCSHKDGENKTWIWSPFFLHVYPIWTWTTWFLFTLKGYFTYFFGPYLAMWQGMTSHYLKMIGHYNIYLLEKSGLPTFQVQEILIVIIFVRGPIFRYFWLFCWARDHDSWANMLTVLCVLIKETTDFRDDWPI